MSEVRNRNLTLVGLQPDDAEPLPLRPYDAAMAYTPSRERHLGEPTPVYIPPARRHTPEQVAEIRRYYRLKRQGRQPSLHRETFTPEPSMLLCACIAAIIMWLTAFALYAVF